MANVEALKQIRDKILTFPEHFNMDLWIRIPDPEGRNEFYVDEIIHVDIERFVHTCGTTACIAGWARILNPEVEGDHHDLADFLGVESDLFYVENWPSWVWEYGNDTTVQAIALLDEYIEGGDPWTR